MKMEAAVAETIFLSAQNTPEAVKSSKALGHIIMSPLQARQHPMVQGRGKSVPNFTTQKSEGQVFQTFEAAFQSQGKRVLLLGATGSGKTTTLLQFALDVARACWDSLDSIVRPRLPVPLFQSVSRWDHQVPLPEWAKETVAAEFKGISFDGLTLLYIFDGLDELGGKPPPALVIDERQSYDPRVKFLRAIETQLPDVQLIISCREQEYEEIGDKAALFGAITLLPLLAEQVETYLTERNQQQLWQIVSADTIFRELVCTPLFLALLSIATADATALFSLDKRSPTTHNIFDYFISQRYAHESQIRDSPVDEMIMRDLLGKMGVFMWTKFWSPATELPIDEIQYLAGERSPYFIETACNLQFLRYTTSGSVQFIHLKFRDYCAGCGFIDLMSTGADDVRLQSIQALRYIGGDIAVPVLTEALLEDRSDVVRSAAARALGDIADATAVPTLINALTDSKTFEIREALALILRKIGSPAVPALMAKLTESVTPDVSEAVIWALRYIRDPAAVPALAKVLKRHQSGSLRSAAAWALGDIGGDIAVPVLTEALLEDRSDVVRSAAARALGDIADAAAVPALTAVLRQHQSGNLHNAATWALMKIQSQ